MQVSTIQAGTRLQDIKDFYALCGYKASIHPQDQVVIAEEDSGIIGAVRLVNEDGFTLLRGMYVHPDLERRGIGTQMLREFELMLRTVPTIYLICGAHLKDFYGKIGFRPLETASQTPPILLERKQVYEDQFGPQAIMVRISSIQNGDRPRGPAAISPKWHERMYDAQSANQTINAPKFMSLAEKEAAFIVSTLKLPHGSKILDVPCGVGRHAKVLAKAGYAVTGVDVNPILLEKAKHNCEGYRVTLKRGNMADLTEYRGQFAAVINMFSSFGYFPTDADNKAALGEMVSALMPGGWFVLHTIDRDWLLKVYEPVSMEETESEVSSEARQYNPETKYNQVVETRIDKLSGKALATYHQMRLYDNAEIMLLLKDAGLADITVYGGFNGEPFVAGETSHPIYIGRRTLRSYHG